MTTARTQTALAAALAAALALTTTTLCAQEAETDKPAPHELAKQHDEAAELAKQLANPIAALISVPFQNNFDYGAGPTGAGYQYNIHIQPVIPIPLSKEWNLITRTIFPIVYQNGVIATSSQGGSSDLSVSAWFSPAKSTNGLTWGIGPIFLFPSASEPLLGTQKWSTGPTAIVLQQRGPWTYGALVFQAWSFAGNKNRQDVSLLFLQPFLEYTFKTHTTLLLQTESAYDWHNGQWTVPINLDVSQVLHIGKQPLSVMIGPRYYADGPRNQPTWGWRFMVTLMYPEKKH